MADLEKRLHARGDLSEEKIQLRLRIAGEEMTHQDEFDVKLENIDGKFEDTVFRAKEMIFRKFPDLR
jgi:guanylate kinase